jgi:hypothetical protein
MNPIKSTEYVHELVLRTLRDPEHDLFIGGMPEDGADDMMVTKVAVMDVPEAWAKTQPWYDSVVADLMDEYPDHDGERYVGLDPSVLDEDDVPTHIVRMMTISNTGWNLLVTIKDDVVTDWHLDELEGNSPGYQGCYEYDGEGAMVNVAEALEWVDALYEDCDDIWI